MNIFVYFALCFVLQSACVTNLFCIPPEEDDSQNQTAFPSAPATGLQRSQTMRAGYPGGSYNTAARPRAEQGVSQHQDGFSSSFGGSRLFERGVMKPTQTNQAATSGSQGTNALLRQILQELERSNSLLEKLVESNGQLSRPAVPSSAPGFVPPPPPPPPPSKNGSADSKLPATQGIKLKKTEASEGTGEQKPSSATVTTECDVSGAVGGTPMMDEMQKTLERRKAKQDLAAQKNSGQLGNDGQKSGPDSFGRSPANVAEVLLDVINSQDGQGKAEKSEEKDNVADLKQAKKEGAAGRRAANRYSMASQGSSHWDSDDDIASVVQLGNASASDQKADPAPAGSVLKPLGPKPVVPERPEVFSRAT